MTWLLVFFWGAIDPDDVFHPPNSVVSEFSAKDSSSEEFLLNYRIHSPRKINRGERYPLILWLHGARERGSDNLEQLRWMELVFLALPPAEWDYFVLAPQCAENDLSWTGEHSQSDALGRAHKLLMRICQQHPIDPDRVYVAGVSSGGSACWEFAYRHPELLAGVLPMASSGLEHSDFKRLSKVPIWAFHSLRDTDFSDLSVRNSVEQLQAAGGSAELTLVDNAKHGIKSLLHEHDCWTGALLHYDGLRWLLSQKKGALFAPKPGRRPWRWWNYAVLIAPVLLIIFIRHNDQRRRLHLSKNDRHLAPEPDHETTFPTTHSSEIAELS